MEKLTYKITDFEGPLDLLITLIQKHKLDIHDIQITSLVEQYLDYIEKSKSLNLDISSEFLEMAARLIHIKSVSLLPKNKEETEKLKQELQGELVEYLQCKKAAEKLTQMADFSTFVREPSTISVDLTYSLKHNKLELLNTLLKISKAKSAKPEAEQTQFFGKVKTHIVSVSSKVIFVMRSAYKKGFIKYKSLFKNSKSKSEAIATFLAVLELIFNKRIYTKNNNNNLLLILNKKHKTKEEIKNGS